MRSLGGRSKRHVPRPGSLTKYDDDMACRHCIFGDTWAGKAFLRRGFSNAYRDLQALYPNQDKPENPCIS